jgi:hypothetical protein
VITYRYNSSLDPPAPFVYVTLMNPVTSVSRTNIPAQVDTAADRTVLPEPLVQELDLQQLGQLEIGGLGGTVHMLAAYAVRLGVHDLPPTLFKVIGSAGEHWILLGRDVLNTLPIGLNGPQQILRID